MTKGNTIRLLTVRIYISSIRFCFFLSLLLCTESRRINDVFLSSVVLFPKMYRDSSTYSNPQNYIENEWENAHYSIPSHTQSLI